MLQNMKRSQRVEATSYFLVFNLVGTRDVGYSFDCDEQGNIDESKLAPEALPNLEMCRKGELKDGTKLQEPRVVSYTNRYTEPGSGTCACGRRVVLESSWANLCTCGREYNGSGQLLAPREHWGEETGETVGDMEVGQVTYPEGWHTDWRDDY